MTKNNPRHHDIIISVGVKDIFIVRKVIEQIRQGGIPCAQQIYLITHSRFFSFFSPKWCQQKNVTLLDESLLINNMTINSVRAAVDGHFEQKMRAGWYFQQFLKMGFALTPYAKEYYLIWDADTLPTSTLYFFDEEGRMLITQKEEHHRPYFATMKRLIGLGKEVNFSFIAEHMLIRTSFMKELIERIEKSDIQEENWWKKIIKATDSKSPLGFSEFETYGTFVNHFYPETVVYRQLHTFRRAGMLFGRMMTKREIREFNGIVDTLSLEAGHIPPFPRNIYQLAQLAFLRLLRP